MIPSTAVRGVHQRVVYRWESDMVGEPITPEQDVGWKALRRELKRAG